MKEKIRDNGEKIKQNKVLPYLVANVVEVRPMQAPSPDRRPHERTRRFWTSTQK